jgi:hypothetical protein
VIRNLVDILLTKRQRQWGLEKVVENVMSTRLGEGLSEAQIENLPKMTGEDRARIAQDCLPDTRAFADSWGLDLEAWIEEMSRCSRDSFA